MGWVGGIITFIVIWWIVFFMVLPWGVQRHEEPEPGHDVGAPVTPRIFTKMLVTTAISLVLLALVWAVQEYNWIDFRALTKYDK